MRLWRGSKFADLSGQGGLRVSGRWASLGSRIVYLSDHPASTLLETLVHLEVDSEDFPDTYQLLAIDIPDDIPFDTVEEGQLAPGWKDDQALTRSLGDAWLRKKQTALMRVPSAIVPASVNWLLNPAHPESALAQIAEIIRAPLDARLFRVD
jgi:RES domain-containing protein